MAKRRALPWAIAGGIGLLWLCYVAGGFAQRGDVDLRSFAQLPVVDRGRVKPIDSVARNSLMVISGRTSFIDERGRSQPAIRWLLDVMTSRFANNPQAEKHKVFRIENDQVLQMLGLKPRDGLRYSVEELSGRIGKLSEQAEKARQTEPAQRDKYQVKVMELAEHLQLYIELAQLDSPLLVPPDKSGDDWQSLRTAAGRAASRSQKGQVQDTDPVVLAIAKAFAAYAQGNKAEFQENVATWSGLVKDRLPAGKIRTVHLETDFNRADLFYNCLFLYFGVLIFTLLHWLVGKHMQGDVLNRTAFYLGVLALAVHSTALFSRMLIQGRPPVTNLYSSAVFIGWGCVSLGLVLEQLLILRWQSVQGVGNMVAAVMGGLTLIIANFLSKGGDTLEMMQAVLDTNFWLATHVTCVTLGYTTTFVAGALGITYIFWGVFGRMSAEARKAMKSAIYGVVCFATMMSFIGTVLGGIWADQSWGRFWGWDPKENGAVLIVIWNALILHARWGGLVKDRGLAVLAVAGNMVTIWSWFGTNQLGVGLHAYGFNNALAMGCAVAWLAHLGVIGLGLLPLKWWNSYSPAAVPVVQSARRHVGKPKPAMTR